MKIRRLMVFGLSFVAISGMVLLATGRIGAQDGLRTLEQNLDVPAEQPSVPAQKMGYMGLTVDLMAPDGKSVYIVSVVENGPAEKGGLRADDVILEINRQKIGDLKDLDGVVRQPPGAKLEFKVRRDGVPQRYEVVLGTRPSAPKTPPTPEPTVGELPAPASRADTKMGTRTPVPRTEGGPPLLEGSRPNLGIRVADAERLSEAEKRRFGVVVDSGAVISGVNEGTPAARAGLPIGGVVVSVNGVRIGNAQDIVDAVRTFRPGEQIEITYWEGDRVGRKKVRVGRAAVAATPAAPTDGTATPGEARPLLRRRGSERPVLNALERILDDVLPPGSAARPPAPDLPPPGDPRAPAEPADAMLPPPPPPRDDAVRDDAVRDDAVRDDAVRDDAVRDDAVTTIPKLDLEPPVAELPESSTDGAEIDTLRKQAVELQRQLNILLLRIKELEDKKSPSSSKATKRR